MITNNYILILTGILLLFLITLFTVSVIAKCKKQNQPQQQSQQPSQPSPKKERHEELIDTLNWMLQYNIIDTREYNNLMVKSLPYLN